MKVVTGDTSNVKLERVPKFYYLGNTLDAGGGVEEAQARVTCARAKFKELSVILTARGATGACILPHKGKDIKSLCPECVDIWD